VEKLSRELNFDPLALPAEAVKESKVEKDKKRKKKG
jgi:hypothetical protein